MYRPLFYILHERKQAAEKQTYYESYESQNL